MSKKNDRCPGCNEERRRWEDTTKGVCAKCGFNFRAVEFRLGAGGEALTAVVLELVEVVTTQQRQIEALRDELDVVTLQQLQTDVSEKASGHLRSALEEAARVLHHQHVSEGEVNVGTVLQKGTIHLTRREQRRSSLDGRSAEKEHRKLNGDAALKLRGILTKLGEVAPQMKAQSESVAEMLNELKAERSSDVTGSAEGSFEIQYGHIGVRLKGLNGAETQGAAVTSASGPVEVTRVGLPIAWMWLLAAAAVGCGLGFVLFALAGR